MDLAARLVYREFRLERLLPSVAQDSVVTVADDGCSNRPGRLGVCGRPLFSALVRLVPLPPSYEPVQLALGVSALQILWRLSAEQLGRASFVAVVKFPVGDRGFARFRDRLHREQVAALAEYWAEAAAELGAGGIWPPLRLVDRLFQTAFYLVKETHA